jgi:uncharacterized protein (TIGR03437 family)
MLPSKLIALAILASAGYGTDFTTYIGDSNQYYVAAIASDPVGNTYVTGSRAIQVGTESTSDVFVTKLDTSGNIVFTTTFGGKGIDQGTAVAVDAAGNVWVGGNTTSDNFPLRDALQKVLTTNSGGQVGFLVKLAPDGTVIYSSYFGGLLGNSSVNGVAADSDGNVYLTGTTFSSDFSTTPGLPAGPVYATAATAVSGAFVTKLDATGQKIIYSALMAGSSVDCYGGSNCESVARMTSGAAIVVDGAGNAVVAGNTNTTDLPVTPGGTSGLGAFAAKINVAGNQLVYLTYVGPPGGMNIPAYGPSEWINASAIAVDGAGNAYLAGSTNDSEFPATPGAYQTKLNGGGSVSGEPADGFVVKLSPAGTTLWATYLGGPGYDAANSISVDNSGDVWLVGTNDAGFPNASQWFIAAAGNFLAELSADGSKLLYSAEFPGGTAGQGVTVDQSGALHVAGAVGLISTITPAEPFASRILGIVNAAAGQVSGRIAAGEVISVFGFGLGPATPVTATPSNGAFPTSLGGVQVLVNGKPIPLLYVSALQINAEIPSPLSAVANGSAVIQVIIASRLGSTTLPEFRVMVDPYIFGIFLNADGSIAAINQDGTLNSSSNPAKSGTVVSIWTTGSAGSGGPITGAVATAANNWCSFCQISLGSLNETVTYAGAAPGLIDGVMQINFAIPTQGATTSIQLSVDFNGFGSGGLLWVQ